MIQTPVTQHELPITAYRAGLEAATVNAFRQRHRHVLFGYVRLGWATLFFALLWLVYGRHEIAWSWLLLPWIGFAITAHFHAGVLAEGVRSRRAMAWYSEGLARIEDRWSGLRPRRTPAAAATSLYAHDLDLFSPGGVFELLCTARTTLGEDLLADWLLAPASLPEVKARQEAVADLRPRAPLREDVWSTAGPDLLILDRPALTAWAHERDTALPPVLAYAAPALVLFFLFAVTRWAMTGASLLLIVAIVLNGSLTYLLQARLNPLFAAAQSAARPLGTLSNLLELFEREHFISQKLQTAQEAFTSSGIAASGSVRKLARLAAAAALRGNPLMRLLDVLLLYSVQLGILTQRWRRRHGPGLPSTLKLLGEFEALLSLSAYSFEHPADALPEFAAEAPVFIAQSLGHPLLPSRGCVRNDVRLDERTRLLLVSGSNMSGKSTLLRSVGVATAMALAGAPVRASSLRLGPFQLAASIQVSDSLQGGHSRFYAEILRLRAICEVARTSPPVLFLLDELLAGTNSHDRVAGAAGVIRELLAAGASGLLSTHDLALTAVPEPEARLIQNAHFQDSILDGTLRFDYTLREGIVTRSNGLALMRLIGLDV